MVKELCETYMLIQVIKDMQTFFVYVSTCLPTHMPMYPSPSTSKLFLRVVRSLKYPIQL